jgi:hypothetical protein
VFTLELCSHKNWFHNGYTSWSSYYILLKSKPTNLKHARKHHVMWFRDVNMNLFTLIFIFKDWLTIARYHENLIVHQSNNLLVVIFQQSNGCNGYVWEILLQNLFNILPH